MEAAGISVAAKRATQRVYAQDVAHPVEAIQKDVRRSARTLCCCTLSKAAD